MKSLLLFSSILLFVYCDANNIPNLTLNDGNVIPMIGLGTWLMRGNDTYLAVKNAIDVGYRHIDTAFKYGNEYEVGRAINDAIREGKINRKDIFVTTKVWNHQHSERGVNEAINNSLEQLKLDYIDLMLIHYPYAYAEGGDPNPKDSNGRIILSKIDYLKTWKALEDAVNTGQVKSIGLANFNRRQTRRVLRNSRIRPAVLQIESHPNVVNKKLIRFAQKNGIAVTAYSPLKRGVLLNDPKLKAIGDRHGKTAAQVMLRFQIQRNVIVIPKSVRREKQIENLQIFDFQLTNRDMKQIKSMNNNQRLIDDWDRPENDE